jgi:hypothetical protein
MIKPATTRSSKIKKRVKNVVGKPNEDGEGAGESAGDEEEEMDHNEVLVTSGANNPKPHASGRLLN